MRYDSVLMINIPMTSYVNDEINNVISQTPKVIHSADSYAGESILFKCGSIVPVGSVEIPKFSTGIRIEQREGWADAVIFATDYEANLYVGYRNGTTWTGRKL